MSKVSRGDKGEALVSASLENIKEYHYLFNDVTFLNKKSEMTHQIDHILIHPHGVFVIETKNYYGKITLVKGENYWMKDTGKEKVKISNPLKQNKGHAITLFRILKGKYEIIPVVVFVKNNAPYLGDENVINLEDLLLFIESYPYKKKLSKKEIDSGASTIKRNISTIDKQEHVENISYLKQMKKEFRDEMSYAIENNKCPRCGHAMISKNFVFKCSYCDFNFKL